MYKKYRTPACKTCPARDLCTGRKSGGREIERSEYAHAVEANLKNLQENKELYKRRQMIISLSRRIAGNTSSALSNGSGDLILQTSGD